MPEELVEGTFNFDTIADRIDRLVLHQRSHGRNWLSVFFVGFILLNVLLLSAAWLFRRGIGIWGTDIPTAWGFPIVNFVWWIGIGHAGTFISAFLYLMRQRWRNSINRFAEAMTIFAVLCAGMFPVFHLGRPWVAYWLAPYWSAFGVWPQFRSPLVWDFFAVSTYLTVSILFWGVALIPDYAALRDKAKILWQKRLFGILSLGWYGDALHWHRFQQVYMILAALATALVVSVHSVVGLDFAVAQLPDWHNTIIPPYFVAGAIFSGFAVLIVLLIPIRAWYRIKGLITLDHIDWMAKMMLVTGLIVGYAYLVEAFLTYYGHDVHERTVMNAMLFGPFRPLHYSVLFINGLLPNALWSKKVRRCIPVVFVIAALIVLGMWLERYEIVTVALRREFLPSAWGIFRPTFWDYSTLLGTIGFFIVMLYLLIRAVPPITVYELKETLEEVQPATAPVLDGEAGVRGFGTASARPLKRPSDAAGLGPPADTRGARTPAESDRPPAEIHMYGDKVMGLTVAYATAGRLLEEIDRIRKAGFTELRAFTPYPVKGLSEALGIRNVKMVVAMFIGALLGGGGGYLLQWYVNVVDFPLNSGGRPYHSWPAFVPPTYECTILLASLTGFFAMLTANGLPRIADPIFSAPNIDRATQDRFLLYISADDPRFDIRGTPMLFEPEREEAAKGAMVL